MIFFYILFITLIKLVHVIIIDKCYYEGDFVVYCNKTRLVSNNQIELIHKAKVTYGIQYNDTLCSHTKLTCSKTYLRHDCIDRAYCEVTNGWLSLEPYCNGNSYYTQFEFDCQPAYYMCDKEHHENVFSGLVLSPSYPLYYTIDSIKNCIQTFVFPSNHYVEIFIENFTMPRSDNCARDFLEILEYKVNKDNVRNAYWKSLTSLCGKYEHNMKIIVKSNILSFKLRTIPLPSGQHSINFKIFIQAISPLAADLVEQFDKDLVKSDDITEENDTISNSFIHTIVAAISALIVIVVVFSVSIFFLIKKKETNYKKPKKSSSTNLQKPIKANVAKKEVIQESFSSSFTPSQSKLTPQPSFTMSKKDTDMPKRLIAERPPLLIDLSGSKLLNKYKSEKYASNSALVSEVRKNTEDHSVLDISETHQNTELESSQVNIQLKSDEKSFIENREEVINEESIKTEKQNDEYLIIENNSEVFTPCETLELTNSASNTPRRIAFNPLHVILKDKAKYYPIEYV